MAQGLSHDNLCFLLKPPRLLPVKRTSGTVQTHNRRIHSKLRPARYQFIILTTHHMPADIMAPPSITDICRIHCKIRLKIQRLPGDNRIPGKPNRIAVTSRPGITRKRHRPLPALCIIQKMIMIQYPKRIKPLYLTVRSLLPVNPPEVHTFLFPWMMQISKIILNKLRVSQITVHRIFIGIIHTHGLRHIHIHFLVRLHTLCRMNI